ncbi:S8 family serine peptidase [Streptomyces sp. NPDC059037]|uniref:S8 family peptidase n=1 Tax=Streptomyces sp. NPDC059037 TaxID=3346710 RepID=UPI0036BD0707
MAAATAVALAAGMTGPASAKADRDRERAATATAAQGEAGTPATARHRITLITGDRVAVDAKRRVTAIEPAAGRERMPVRTLRTPTGHTLVIPADAQRLITTGKLDQRLFDITELSKKDNRRAQQKGLKLIVDYTGAAAGPRSDLRAAGDTTVRRTLKTLNADAITTPKQDAADLWKALTAKRGASTTSTASGIERIWLDGTRRASLDKSVPQIGAPKAWEAGFDGKGVKIAVLDTGVDATHPDLKGQVAAKKNFTTSPDTKDRIGHGTHVASTAAGTGAKSGGKLKGVAPGAKLLNGKVLDDTGAGSDSEVIAGMEWAAAQGADIVNLSLGGDDEAGVDPLEATVNKLSKDKGILFAIAAGNDGYPRSVGSPASADAALTVGAVDDNGKLADFSSQGPRVGDGAIKPDVTAPGVDITAAAAPGSIIDQEVGQKPDGYLTISGTSMATPHVAGAAALLKQQHPNWKHAELKGALTASTKDGGHKYTPYQQGSGRIAVDRAMKQTIVAKPGSLNYGTQQWPHTDDKPVTKKVTYRNLGSEAITLDLTVQTTNPKGDPAPTGFFKLGAKTVKVPAGGTAAVDLTADTKLGGTADGTYSAYVVATGAGQTVRTAAVVDREIERHEVTIKTIGRDGKPAPHYGTLFAGITGGDKGLSLSPYNKSGTAKVRVANGSYLLDWSVFVDPDNTAKGTDWLVRPKLTVDKDMTVTLDARKAKPVDIKLAVPGAKQISVRTRYWYEGYGLAPETDSFKSLRTAHLGPEVPDGLSQQWLGTWTKGADTQYEMFLGGKVKKLATGYTKRLTPADFATVKVGMGASSPGRKGSLSPFGYVPGSHGTVQDLPEQKLPRTRTLHLSALGATKWAIDFEQYGEKDEDGNPTWEGLWRLRPPKTFKAGKTYQETFNTGVFGPALNVDKGISRKGDELGADIPLVADGTGRSGWTPYSAGKSTLYRNGTKIAENEDPVTGSRPFKVPAGEAEYKLTTSMKRSTKLSRVTSRVDASWTFRSARAENAQLPASTVRFTPKLSLASTAPAGARQSIPVKVQGPAAAPGNLKSLTVYASYDAGRTWKKTTPVTEGEITVKNPAAGKSISLRANLTDKQGNKSTLSIYDAYFGK